MGNVLSLIGGFNSVYLIFFRYCFLFLIPGLAIILFYALRQENWKVWCVFGIALTVSLLTFLYFHYTFRVTRDCGAYTNSALFLSTEESYVLSDGKFHLPGLAKTRTGGVTPSFLVGYATYLELFFGNFDFAGFAIANSLLIFLTLFFVFLCTRLLANDAAGLLATLFMATHFTTLWFPRRTLSENLFIFLIWFGLYLALRAIRKQRAIDFVWSLIPIAVTTIARVEGYALLLSFLVINIFLYLKQKGKKRLPIFLLALLILVLALGIYINYRYSSGYFVNQFKNITSLIPRIFSETSGQSLRGQISAPRFANTSFVINMFWYYLLIPFVLTIGIGLWKKVYQEKSVFLPLIYLSPLFVYLYDPRIAQDQPWAMRRFWPTTVPLIFLLASIALLKLTTYRNKTTSVMAKLLVFVLLGFNLTNSVPILSYKQNHEQLLQIDTLVDEFNKDDILITSRDYYDSIGRWATFLKFYGGLNVIWPVNVPEEELVSFLRASQDKSIYYLSKNKDPEEIVTNGINSTRELSELCERNSWDYNYIDSISIKEDTFERAGLQFPAGNKKHEDSAEIYIFEVYLR